MKKCSTCGGKPLVLRKNDNWQIECLNCGFKTEIYNNKRELILDWNRGICKKMAIPINYGSLDCQKHALKTRV